MVGRPAISDEEKRRRGTLDPRWTEEARAARKGDKIVSLFGDRVDNVPPPPAGIHKDAAAEYMRWCRALLQDDKLTALWVERIQMLAIAKHNNLARLAEGKMPRGEDMKTVRSVISELSGVNADTQIAPGLSVGRKFAIFGFAGRVQPPQAGKVRGK